jgi:hypothetical protein
MVKALGVAGSPRGIGAAPAVLTAAQFAIADAAVTTRAVSIAARLLPSATALPAPAKGQSERVRETAAPDLDPLPPSAASTAVFFTFRLAPAAIDPPSTHTGAHPARGTTLETHEP